MYAFYTQKLQIDCIKHLSTFQTIVLASTGHFKFEFFINQKPIFIAFTTGSQQTQTINLGLAVDTTDDIYCNITNQEKYCCDAYVSAIIVDQWDMYERKFTEQLEEELAKK